MEAPKNSPDSLPVPLIGSETMDGPDKEFIHSETREKLAGLKNEVNISKYDSLNKYVEIYNEGLEIMANEILVNGKNAKSSNPKGVEDLFEVRDSTRIFISLKQLEEFKNRVGNKKTTLTFETINGGAYKKDFQVDNGSVKVTENKENKNETEQLSFGGQKFDDELGLIVKSVWLEGVKISLLGEKELV